MGYAKGGDNKTAFTGNVVMKKDGASQLKWEGNKYRSASISKKRTRYVKLSLVKFTSTLHALESRQAFSTGSQ